MTVAPHTILALGDQVPKVDPTAFVAPGAHVIGDVEIGADSSLWYNVVVRGDDQPIRIGRGTNIQDGTVVHVTSGTHPTTIGNDVLIGHLAMIHGCDIHDRAFVGLGSIVMDGCVIESDAMLAAGAMLTPGKRIPSGELWAGRPAKFLRKLSDEEIVRNPRGSAHYVDKARRHAEAIAEATKP